MFYFSSTNRPHCGKHRHDPGRTADARARAGPHLRAATGTLQALCWGFVLQRVVDGHAEGGGRACVSTAMPTAGCSF